MQTFSYHEKPSSKIPVWAKTVRKTLSLMKAGVRCNDPEKKERIKKRLISLRLNSNMKNYPEWFSNHPQSRLAVYTVLFGDYDTVKPVKYKSPKCDYYIITDQPVDDGLGWTKIEREIPVELRNASNAIKNRYFKMHPDVLFPDYE